MTVPLGAAVICTWIVEEVSRGYRVVARSRPRRGAHLVHADEEDLGDIRNVVTNFCLRTTNRLSWAHNTTWKLGLMLCMQTWARGP